ncbi:flagellin N-terminal helical domain-containing protein [Sanguibacter suaedae]|uniref:Flagellin n=1 Tax=Sanguibacter suaedae TaxID=2795737 RepID=A0A934ICU4_9MICO|nr:flagellin [Sanguibacter suaedae]MBI9114564.1 flagellin [Sanguibacter suaedae]
MGLSINQNIAAVNSYRNLSNTQNDLGKSLEKLSSGFRINRAADDAAGLAISEGLRSQVGGLKVAARNAQDGISVVQTAEGALTETHAILQRLRDLGVQGANDSNNTEARANIQTEADELVKELDRIGSSTNFNGTKLLDGSAGSNTGKLSFQVGAGSGTDSRIEVDLNKANVVKVAEALTSGSGAVVGTSVEVATPTAVEGEYTFASAAGASVTVDLGAADSHKSVNDVAGALNKDAAFAQNFTASVNKDNELVVKAKTGDAVTVTAETGAAGIDAATAADVLGGLSFTDHASSQASIDLIDDQIKSVSSARAELGAMQNRFEHTIKNINVSVENLSASESRIRDTDMASEMVSFTRAQILSQAGTSMLAQANQIPQGVLSLLR